MIGRYTGLLLAAALAPGAQTMPMPMAMTTVGRGQLSGVESARHVVVRAAGDWAALWKAHAADEPRPQIDFARATVVGVFLGTRRTGGYDVEIVRVDREGPGGRDIVVTWRERRPPPDALTAQVITSPFHLVRLDRVDGKVRFVGETP